MTEGCVKYRKGYHWALAEAAVFTSRIPGYQIFTDFIDLNPFGKLLLSLGYATDGITGVTGWPWERLLARPWLRYASFGHDGLYQLIRAGLLPPECKVLADEDFYQWCLDGGAWDWQAKIAHAFVVKWGKKAAFEPEREVLTVP